MLVVMRLQIGAALLQLPVEHISDAVDDGRRHLKILQADPELAARRNDHVDAAADRLDLAGQHVALPLERRLVRWRKMLAAHSCRVYLRVAQPCQSLRLAAPDSTQTCCVVTQMLTTPGLARGTLTQVPAWLITLSTDTTCVRLGIWCATSLTWCGAVRLPSGTVFCQIVPPPSHCSPVFCSIS